MFLVICFSIVLFLIMSFFIAYKVSHNFERSMALMFVNLLFMMVFGSVMFESGFKDGQIKALNGKYYYVLTPSEDGELSWEYKNSAKKNNIELQDKLID